MADSELYAELNKRWESACKLLFGDVVGELSDYKEWLSERADCVFTSKSTASGRDISYANGDYCKGAKWISFDEIDFGKKFPPLSINDTKDIDSIISAASENFCYAGNVILGNSKYIERSANVSDSFYVYESSRIGDSKYIAYTSMARLCESVFGTAAPGESQYLIRCNDTYKVKRAHELWMTANCTDCHYVFALNNCSECMFSFNLRSTHYAIGNTVLEKGRYLQLKRSLLEQMRDELMRKKRLPSLMDMIKKSGDSLPEIKAAMKGHLPLLPAEKKDMQTIEDAFTHTSKIVLGAGLSPLSTHQQWLTRHIRRYEKRKSAFSGAEVFVGDYGKYYEIPRERTVREGEALKWVEICPPQQGIEKITMQNAHEFMGKIAYMALDYHDGTNRNVNDCFAYAYSANTFVCFPCVEIKDSAYNFWPRSSEHIFGCGVLFDSQFCINCYQSVKLSRCFEVDSSRDCSDCYYCHNIENCQSCMFCFNAKNLRYAIGNVEVGREKFLETKVALLKNVGARLLKNKDLELDIFNLGCGR